MSKAALSAHVMVLLMVGAVTAAPSDAGAGDGEAGRAPAPSATVAAVGWLSGSWAGTAKGVEIEEHWTAPRGGTLVGMHRDVRDGRTVGFEFLRIEERDGTLHYVASPGGAAPTTFTLVEAGRERVVFENPAHDFPQRILYWKEGGALRARIEGRQDGRIASEEWTWPPSTLTGR